MSTSSKPAVCAMCLLPAKNGERLKSCGACSAEVYCNRECQKFAWTHWHKELCGSGHERVRKEWTNQIEIKQCPGDKKRGLGMFAKTMFHRGEVIIREEPLLYIPEHSNVEWLMESASNRSFLCKETFDLMDKRAKEASAPIFEDLAKLAVDYGKFITTLLTESKLGIGKKSFELFQEETKLFLEISEMYKKLSEQKTPHMEVLAGTMIQEVYSKTQSFVDRQFDIFKQYVYQNATLDHIGIQKLMELYVPEDIVSNHSDAARLWYIYKCNRFSLNPIRWAFTGKASNGVFEKLSRVNHDCSPNSIYTWDHERHEMVLTALRPISEEEEITIMYESFITSVFEKKHVSRQAMEFRYFFTCACKTCSSFNFDNPLIDKMKHLYSQTSDLKTIKDTELLIKALRNYLTRLGLPVDDAENCVTSTFLFKQRTPNSATCDLSVAERFTIRILKERIGPIMSDVALLLTVGHERKEK